MNGVQSLHSRGGVEKAGAQLKHDLDITRLLKERAVPDRNGTRIAALKELAISWKHESREWPVFKERAVADQD